MSLAEFLLFLHILAAMVWIGGAFAAQVFSVLTRRAADPAKSAFFAQNVSFIGQRVFLPAAVVVLGTGIWIVEDVGWDWSEPFISWGLLIWAVAATTAFGYLARAMGKVGARLSAEGPSPELMTRMRNLVYLSRVLLGLLVVVVFLMTVKPGT